MHRFLFLILLIFTSSYCFPQKIESILDSIDFSSGDNEVDKDYINNFYIWVDTLESYFYKVDSDVKIGEVLFSAYNRFIPSLPLWRTNDSTKIIAARKKHDKAMSRRLKLLNFMATSKDSLNVITLKLLFNNSEEYYNTFTETHKIEYEVFKNQIFKKLLKNPDMIFNEILNYFQSIECDTKHKNEIDSICLKINQSKSNAEILIGLLSFCTSCLMESISDKQLLKCNYTGSLTSISCAPH